VTAAIDLADTMRDAARSTRLRRGAVIASIVRTHSRRLFYLAAGSLKVAASIGVDCEARTGSQVDGAAHTG